MADRLFFQDLFTDNTKMPKEIGCQHHHYWQMITVKYNFPMLEAGGK